MKLLEYVEELNKLLSDHPEASEFLVVSAIDDEGNGFNLVSFGPQVGTYDVYEKQFDEDGGVDNAVCIN